MPHPFPILADAGLPTWAATLTVIAFFVSIIGNLAQYGMYRTMQKRQDISPQPLIIAMEKEFTTKTEFKEHAASNDVEIKRLWDQREKDQITSSDGRHKLYAKVDNVGNEVAALQAVTELQNQKMASMDAKLDRLIERR